MGPSACIVCKGACCESMVLEKPSDEMVGEWLESRGRPLDGIRIEIETVCPKLVGGGCSIYATRPGVCRNYEVGGVDCRETVRRRRKNWEEIFTYME